MKSQEGTTTKPVKKNKKLFNDDLIHLKIVKPDDSKSKVKEMNQTARRMENSKYINVSNQSRA